MSMDLEQLARETLELSVLLRNGYSSINQQEELSSIEKYINKYASEKGAGVVYKIESSAQTFCIKGMALESIEAFLQKIREEDGKSVLNYFKTDIENIFDIKIYKTKSYQIAKILQNNMINIRFPIEEDMLCNLSDPGFSWWMEITPCDLIVHFKSHGIERASKLIKLGPMGDQRKAKQHFNQAFKIFNLLFSVKEFSCSSKSLKISTNDQDSLSFKMLQNIFIKGINSFELGYPFNTPVFIGFYKYLIELSTLRKFWLTIEDDIINFRIHH